MGNILQESSYPQTKCWFPPSAVPTSMSTDLGIDLALQVLDDVIMTRWKVLPREQCLGTSALAPVGVRGLT